MLVAVVGEEEANIRWGSFLYYAKQFALVEYQQVHG